jgi:hypothetical protein
MNIRDVGEPTVGWFDAFLVNVCEIPDRNSPEGEPEAIVATLKELRNCALNTTEQLGGNSTHGKVHPWMAFLTARRECIRWMLSEGKAFDTIAAELSMDAEQVSRIVEACGLLDKGSV